MGVQNEIKWGSGDVEIVPSQVAVIPALGKLREEDQKLEASLSYVANLRLALVKWRDSS